MFIDKDGTLIENVPYNVDPDRLAFVPGAVEALGILQQNGFRLMILTNQSGIARGYFTTDQLQAFSEALTVRLRSEGIDLDGFYFCPHSPDGCVSSFSINCNCRKPAAGLFLRAAVEQNVRLTRSWMIGDILDDVEAGHRAGCRSILLDTGGENQWLPGPYREPDFIATRWSDAAGYILQHD